MQNVIASLDAVLPVFLLILLGMLLKSFKLLNDSTIAQLNRLVFIVLIPILLFRNIYGMETGNVMYINLLIFCLSAMLLFWVIVAFFVCISLKDSKIRGATIQGINRGNYILFALPIAERMASETGYGMISVIAVFAVVLVNLLSVITLEIFKKEKIHFTKIWKSIITNPIIIGSILGFIALTLNIAIPAPLHSAVTTLSAATLPIGLIIMGAAFKFDKIKGNRVLLSISFFIKLVLFPSVAITTAMLLEFRNIDLLTVLLLFAAPTSVSSYPMAVEMNSDGDFACQMVVFTTMFACFFNFAFIFILKYSKFI